MEISNRLHRLPDEDRLGIGYLEPGAFVVALGDASGEGGGCGHVAAFGDGYAEAFADEGGLGTGAAIGFHGPVGEEGGQAAVEGHGAAGGWLSVDEGEVAVRAGHVPDGATDLHFVGGQIVLF